MAEALNTRFTSSTLVGCYVSCMF